MLLAVGAFSIARTVLDEEAFLAWGWRIPFLISGLLVFIGLLIRIGLSEPEKFAEMKQNDTIADRPVVELFRNERRAVYLTTGMRLSQNAIYYLYTVFGIAYIARSLGSATSVGLNSVLVASAIGLVSVPIWAAMSDKVGRRPLYLFGAITSALFIGPFFLLADTGNPVLITLAMVIGLNFFHDAMYGPQAAFFSEMFSTGVRYSGASVGYQIGSVFAGGFSPLIATSLLAVGNGSPWLVVGYFTILSVITAVCAYLAPETNKKDIDDDTPNQARVAAPSSHDTPSPSNA